MTDRATCFIDTETTGLHPDLHAPWEIAVIRREPDGVESETVIQISGLDMARADPMALQIGGYYERHPMALAGRRLRGLAYVREETAAGRVEKLARDALFVGVNPAFDAAMLERMLRRNGYAPAWHYHLIDLPALALGWLAGRYSTQNRVAGYWGSDDRAALKSDDLSLACGIDPGDYERHTALGDARWTRDWHDHLLGVGGAA